MLALHAGLVWLALAGVAWGQSKPRVVATIFPLADVVGRLAGAEVAVTTLLPAGASPHTFEPNPGLMREIAGATLVVRVGAGLDDWAIKLLDAASTPPRLLTVSEGIELLPTRDAHDHAHGHAGDPHLWLDPILMRDHVVPALLQGLKAQLPARSAELDRAATAYRTELTDLDAEVRGLLASVSRRKVITFHSAWRYFAHRYGLEEVAVVEESPGKEPSARAVARLVEVARANQVRAILAEPQYSPRLAEQIAREFQGVTVLVDPMGGGEGTGRGSYLDLMRFNAKAFGEALK